MKKLRRHDPILIKYRDDEKIITSINRPTENAAFQHIGSFCSFNQRDLRIYHQELKFIKDGCDPELVITKISNHLLMKEELVRKSLRRIERYLKYEEFMF